MGPITWGQMMKIREVGWVWRTYVVGLLFADGDDGVCYFRG